MESDPIDPIDLYGATCTKGGVGKTIIFANIGAILADMGQPESLARRHDCEILDQANGWRFEQLREK